MTFSLVQHIEELRAELKNAFNTGERRVIAAELELAQAEMIVTMAEQDGLLDAEPPF